MRWLLLIPGIALVLLAVVDAMRTTLAVGSVAGPVTGRINHALWGLFLRSSNRRVLQLAATPLTLNTLALWLLLLWAGWTLIFAADPTAVVSETGQPLGGWDRAYFTGTTLFTLGPGDVRAHGTPWRIVSVFALVNGLFLVTLGITYIIPVATAATERRRTAALIAALGNRPDDAILGGYDHGQFGALRHYLMTLAPDIALLAQRHLAYPVLHFFHSGNLHTAAAPMIARLDEIVTLLRFGLVADQRPDPYVTRPVHEALTQFLNTLHSVYIDPVDAPPPPPPLYRLREAGLPVVDDERLRQALAQHERRRRLLLALVENDGWSWDDVWPEPIGPPVAGTEAGEHEPTGAGEEHS